MTARTARNGVNGTAARLGRKERKGRKRPVANTAKINSGYRFQDKDPMIDRLVAGFQDSDLSYGGWAWRAGLSETTLRNWDSGKTRSPQYRSIVCAALALDMEFGLFPRGAVAPQHRLPSTSFYEKGVLRWQRDHQARQPAAVIPARERAS